MNFGRAVERNEKWKSLSWKVTVEVEKVHITLKLESSIDIGKIIREIT